MRINIIMIANLDYHVMHRYAITDNASSCVKLVVTYTINYNTQAGYDISE